ncbi:MAG: hypothetical protein ABL899_02010 [Nitrospira sp.]
MNKINILKNKINQSGFTLLIAIVLASSFLVISFVVVNVAFKQLRLTNAGQESQYAFYASDAGTECAVYWDLKVSGSSPFLSPFSAISCGNSANVTPSLVSDDGVVATSTVTINFTKGCAIINVGKAVSGMTTIDSKGYNDCNNPQRKFERGVTLAYDAPPIIPNAVTYSGAANGYWDFKNGPFIASTTGNYSFVFSKPGMNIKVKGVAGGGGGSNGHAGGGSGEGGSGGGGGASDVVGVLVTITHTNNWSGSVGVFGSVNYAGGRHGGDTFFRDLSGPSSYGDASGYYLRLGGGKNGQGGGLGVLGGAGGVVLVASGGAKNGGSGATGVASKTGQQGDPGGGGNSMGGTGGGGSGGGPGESGLGGAGGKGGQGAGSPDQAPAIGGDGSVGGSSNPGTNSSGAGGGGSGPPNASGGGGGGGGYKFGTLIGYGGGGGGAGTSPQAAIGAGGQGGNGVLVIELVP